MILTVLGTAESLPIQQPGFMRSSHFDNATHYVYGIY
ncbi:hypothetical protein NIES21_52170 [Anabaenopsis circularis NIES-21]|uniref:Uncharacterized protein n=1 Tax=Anabaenopsis circularis NIES-21 TaxID=1085406 RepID=A0A1Z4GPW0_9CYAN|nr:hypothetical protein NIES21_52170 [Anabaenopsis circularis NIES-21]